MNSSDDQHILSILNNCDDEQLKRYMNNDQDCETFVKTLESYQALISERQYLESTNRSLAESNLAMEPMLETAKAKLRSEIDEFERAKQEYLSIKETFDTQVKCGDDLSLGGVLSALQSRAQRAEEETDRTAEEFFSASGHAHTDEELNAFQRQFLENRTQAHLIKIKADKLKELLANWNR